MSGIRTKEVSTKEVMANVNDLIIELMKDVNETSNEVERKVYKKVIQTLTYLRDRHHGTSGKIS